MSALPPLVIRSAGTLLDDAATLYPTVMVDATGRPDVADLPRVVASEGVGDLTTRAEPMVGPGGRRLLRLRMSMSRPVEVEWSVDFHLPGFADLLSLAAECGCLVFAFGRDVEGDASGLDPGDDGWLGVDLDAAAVRAILDFGR